MNTIFLVCEAVDLGYHVVGAHTDEVKAKERVEALTTAYRKDKIDRLVKFCNHTLEQAQNYASQDEPYFLESIALDD